MAAPHLQRSQPEISRADDCWAPQARLAFEDTAAALDLEPAIVERFRHPVEESTAYLQLMRDSGDAVSIPLFQVRHTAMWGETIGSLSILADLQRQDCEAIAMERSWQAALLGLPWGGASYGLVCDPDEMSERELVQVLRRAARVLARSRIEGSLIMPGHSCRREFMAKLFAVLRGRRHVKVCGKPDCLRGLDLDRFAAEGTTAIIARTLSQAGKSGDTAKVAVQGFGPLGQAVCRCLADAGFSVIAVSDTSAGIYRSDGLLLDDVRAHVAREELLLGYAQAERISRGDLLHVKADVLVLTQGPNELQTTGLGVDAPSVFVEADWNAVTPLAKEQLASRSVFVPWVLAACGTLCGAYIEGGNLHGLSTEEELLLRTRRACEQATSRALAYADANDCSFSQAVYCQAIERAASSARLVDQD